MNRSFCQFADIPETPVKTESDGAKVDDVPKTRRRRHRFQRQAAPNSIDVENTDNGKSTTIAPRAEESIQIVNENVDNLSDRNANVVFDGPLDADSNYSGFVEVIGKFKRKKQFKNQFPFNHHRSFFQSIRMTKKFCRRSAIIFHH